MFKGLQTSFVFSLLVFSLSGVGTTTGNNTLPHQPIPLTCANPGTPKCRCKFMERSRPADKQDVRAEAQESAAAVSKDLHLETKNLSAQTRRYVSATDKRQSSQALGAVGIAFLVIVFFLLIQSDVVVVVRKIFAYLK